MTGYILFAGDPLFEAPPRHAPGPVAGQFRALSNFDRKHLVEASVSELLGKLDNILAAPGAEGLVFLPYLDGERTPPWSLSL